MKTGKFYSRWQIVAVLWLMMAFPVSFVHGQEKVSARQTDSTSREEEQVVSGHVCDKQGVPIIGASIACQRTGAGVVTDVNGNFTLKIKTKRDQETLVISYLGMKRQNQVINFAQIKQPLKFVMEEDTTSIDQVVVTGIYNRTKESFTGSYATYDVKELKNAGNINIIQSLKTIDPSFALLENNMFGSDPNQLADVEIRGKTSIVGFKEVFGEDPNQPLFILDGFETTLQTIMDLSLDRVASVTVLKDAASTAIYGAKAANGVVVVETKSPEPGRLRVSYSGNFDISFADLSDYNLMNAREKLEFERLAGRFESNLVASEGMLQQRYNDLLAEVERGVDTYWMSEPLRLGLNQRHNLYVEGGDERMRYGVGLNLNNQQGVMKNSDRRVFSGNVDLLYRVGKLSFSNKLTIDATNLSNPVVPFSEYAEANPYYRKYNETGGIDQWLEARTYSNPANVGYTEIWVGNPLWNDSQNSYDKGNGLSVQNNFQLEYRPLDYLYVRGRFSVQKSIDETEAFTSPTDTQFDGEDLLMKGWYRNDSDKGINYNGDLTVTFGKLFDEKHQVNAVLGSSISEATSVTKGFEAIGFPEGDFTTPAFSNQYAEGGKPSYSDYKKRSASFYFNGNYSFDNRYLLDVNLRSDGSSVFGTNKRFTTTWAVGVAWNLHNEPFLKNLTDAFSMFKLRSSIGNPGNQNFGSFTSITTYRFNNWMMNNFGTGLLINDFGDPDLDWQKTINLNVGIDLSIRNRLHLTFDYYNKHTDPLLASVGIPLSVGTSSRLMNIGQQINKGFDGSIRYAILYRPEQRINWTVGVDFRHNRAYYDGIGDKLSQYNAENQTKSLMRYYDGGSPTALYAVRSEGIDPATGREIFLTASGKRTFTHSYNDEVLVGDTNPDMEGTINSSLYWKGFSCSFYLRYSWGADQFNSTLYNKVENISEEGLKVNQDKRALYDRWQKPGDIAQFKGISLTEYTPMSSRFVQKNNYIELESVRVSYEFQQKWMSKVGISGLILSAYMNDICRFSSIEDERGISYPFARSVSLSLTVNF